MRAASPSRRSLAGVPSRRNRTLRRAGTLAYSVFRLVLLLAIGYIILYPLLYMLSMSVKTEAAFWDPSVVWLSKSMTIQNFKTAFEVMHFDQALLSTLRLEVVSALIEVISCAVAAYGLARFEFRGKRILMVMLLLLILLPSQMLVIPMMNNFSHLDFLGILHAAGRLLGRELRPSVLDTVWTFYLPSMLGVGLRSGVMIYIYYQFFRGLPKELEEAAWIDGSNPLRTFISIAVPSSGVVILTVTVLSVVWHWNDYYLSVMYTSDHFPLAVALAQLRENLTVIKIWDARQAATITMAGSLMFIAPVFVMYMILQRKFVKSIDRVGITG